MSTKKDDLTRIEDLGEFLHESDNEEATSFEGFGEEEESSSSFENLEETSEETPEFESSGDFLQDDTSSFNDDSTSPFGESSSFEETSTFEEESPAFGMEEPSFLNHEEEELPSEEPSFSANEEEATEIEASEDSVEPLSEQEQELTPLPDPEPHQEYIPEPVIKAPETFEEVRRFAESTSFTGMGVEGNPSFSVLIKNVRFVEDVSDIINLLRELGLLSDTEDQVRARLMRGNLLVPRISEYAAIFLAHKLRRFDIDIQVGPSDEIHPPKHHEAPEVGMVSKHSLYQNQSHHFRFDDSKLELSQIIVAATPTLEGYQVVRYLGVASEHQMLDGKIVEDEISDDIPRYYHELAQKLRAHALKARANAVVGLNYQLTPLPTEYGHSTQKYRLSCTGNLVWVKQL